MDSNYILTLRPFLTTHKKNIAINNSLGELQSLSGGDGKVKNFMCSSEKWYRLNEVPLIGRHLNMNCQYTYILSLRCVLWTNNKHGTILLYNIYFNTTSPFTPVLRVLFPTSFLIIIHAFLSYPMRAKFILIWFDHSSSISQENEFWSSPLWMFLVNMYVFRSVSKYSPQQPVPKTPSIYYLKEKQNTKYMSMEIHRNLYRYSIH